ncbi:MAG: hypothetical protein JXR94_20225, partial [Candidatus Hydrogenedentes bacterium]|nr:hypothetical protein [Candidatus Hydrogenedentota bacterium]
MRRRLKITLTACCCLIVFAVFAVYVYIHPGRGPRLDVDADQDAYLEEIDGTIVLHLKGTPYEMGYQHGFLARDRVSDAMALFDGLLGLARKETGMPRAAVEFVLDWVYAGCAPHIPERHRRELEGLADGAGVDLQMLRRFHVLSVLSERDCSVFAVFGKATGNGHVFHGRNFDWNMSLGLQDNAALILYKPEGMVPFASAGYLGTVGILSGMNMEGIAVGQVGAINTDGRHRGIPLMFLLRRILEEAHDVDDATRIIQNARRTVGYNYLVADGDAAEARAYETSAHYCAVFTDNDPKEALVEYAIPIDDAVFRADTAMDQNVRRHQRCAKGYPNMPYGSQSYDGRYKPMATMIREGYGAIDQAAALAIVKAVA